MKSLIESEVKKKKSPIKMGCAVSNAREKEAQERSKNIDKLLKSEAEKNACIKLLLLGMRYKFHIFFYIFAINASTLRDKCAVWVIKGMKNVD